MEEIAVSVARVPSRFGATRAFLRESLGSRAVWLCVLLGAAGTVAWAALSASRGRESAKREFEERSLVAARHVAQSFQAPLEALYGIHALGCALPEVDQPRFERFGQQLLSRYPSLAALELFDVVSGDERADFERRVSSRIGRPFSIQEPSLATSRGMVTALPRERHVVLTRFVPYQKELHGLDLTFDSLRREQIAAATRAGAPLVTGKFRLVEDSEGVYSVAVYHPLFAGSAAPPTEAERSRNLTGFAVALYRLEPLMTSALSGTRLEKITVGLVDRDPQLPRGDSLLFGTLAARTDESFSYEHEIRFAGRNWALVTSRAVPTFASLSAPSLALGSVGTLLVAGLIGLGGSLRKSRQRFQALQALGPYTLLREIGGGGMGRVFEAQHRLLRRRTAIKVVAQEVASPEQLRRFDLEAKTTSELRHPNTVVVFDYGRTPTGDFYYAMEYVHGVTWDQLVQRHGAQPAARVRHLLLQACGALSEAHGLGLVHRDVKPSNLMLGVSGGIFDFVKVLDFGLVRVTRGAPSGLSKQGTLLGTPRYMAPESFASSQSGPRADLYALGCVAYYLLSGHEPFTAKTDAGVATLHLTQMPSSLRGRGRGDTTPELERIVMRCLAKNPDDRFASAAQLLRALSELSLPPWTQTDAAAFWAEQEANQ
ncbi:MAG: Serine/threonine-protein kinase pkn3 [Polyangiaceae bacterium]|nr:Serine/threonine-protein kinase pkn3 [Polyangiaceae bacterium]